jgi:threonyl-tRNA synthetase
MIHRALMGSFERFMGILIEHYAGEFPLWLAPLQALVLPVSDRRGDSIGRKIRDAEIAKVPYMLIVGDREAESGAAALRRHREGDLGTLALDAIADRLAAEAAERRAAA